MNVLPLRAALPALVVVVIVIAAAFAPTGDGAKRPLAATPVAGQLVLALTNPERIAVVDLATGRVAQRRLPGGTLCRSPLTVVGDRVVFVAAGSRGGHVMAVDVALDGQPRRVAAGDVVVPATTPGHAWAADRVRGGRERWIVPDVDVAAAVVRRVPRAAPLPVVGSVVGGLVLQSRRSTVVWDPRSGRRSRAAPGLFLLAAAGRRIASCGDDCSTVLLADGRRGRLVHAPGGGRFLPRGAAFSGDGTRLAVATGRIGRPRLAIVDVARGSVELVPGARLGLHATFAWGPDGETLYSVGPHGAIRAHRVGARRPVRVGVRVEDPVTQLLAVG